MVCPTSLQLIQVMLAAVACQARLYHPRPGGGVLGLEADDPGVGVGGGAGDDHDYPSGGSGGRPFTPTDRGFQFSSFRGPVSGVIREVEVPFVPPPGIPGVPTYGAQYPSHTVDYEAKPDYSFHFGVQDPESGNAQVRHETRDGDKLRGEYSVMEPDGTLRTVTYTADPVKGFQAKVRYGPSGLPPPPPPTTTRAPAPYRHPGASRPRPGHRFTAPAAPALAYDDYSDTD